jgi:hypothetical protein
LDKYLKGIATEKAAKKLINAFYLVSGIEIGYFFSSVFE